MPSSSPSLLLVFFVPQGSLISTFMLHVYTYTYNFSACIFDIYIYVHNILCIYYMYTCYILYNCVSFKFQSTNNRKHNICFSEAGSTYLIYEYQIISIFLLWLKKPTVNENRFFFFNHSHNSGHLGWQAPSKWGSPCWGSVEAVVGLIDTAMAGESEAHILPQLAEFQRSKFCYYHYYY